MLRLIWVCWCVRYSLRYVGVEGCVEDCNVGEKDAQNVAQCMYEYEVCGVVLFGVILVPGIWLKLIL